MDYDQTSDCNMPGSLDHIHQVVSDTTAVATVLLRLKLSQPQGTVGPDRNTEKPHIRYTLSHWFESGILQAFAFFVQYCLAQLPKARHQQHNLVSPLCLFTDRTVFPGQNGRNNDGSSKLQLRRVLPALEGPAESTRPELYSLKRNN